MRHTSYILFSVIFLLTACQPAPGSSSTLSNTPLTTVTLERQLDPNPNSLRNSNCYSNKNA